MNLSAMGKALSATAFFVFVVLAGVVLLFSNTVEDCLVSLGLLILAKLFSISLELKLIKDRVNEH